MKRAFKKLLAMLLICCMVATVAAVSSTTEVEAASFTYNQNVSSSKVTKSSTSGSMPTAVSSVKGGKSYYFNLQTSNTYYITSAALYVKLPGDSGYTKVYTKSNSNGFRIVAYSYTINNTKGTLYYYWKIDYKTSSSSTKKVKQTSTKSITVSATKTISSTYNSSLNSFLSKSKFKNGASWSSSKTCQVSPYGTKAKGCCAYVADLVYTLYGAKTPSSGTSFTSVSSIRAGDVLKMTDSSGNPHWIYVYGRSGNTLYTAAGNESSKVCVSTSKYTISGSKIKTSSTTYTLTKGYHYEP